MSDPEVHAETETEPSEEAIIVIVSEDGSGEVAVDGHLLQEILGSTETEMLSMGPVPKSEVSEDKSVAERLDAPEEAIDEPEEEFAQTEPMDILEDEEKMPVEPIGPMSEQISSLLTLDEEEIKKIEHALQSQEADEILGESFQSILEPEAELDDLLDPVLSGVPDHEPLEDDDQEPHMPISLEDDNSGLDTDSSATLASGRSVSPKRRSQRQIDRLEREQLEKIRAENEQMLKKEKETMLKKDEDKIDKPEVQTEEKPVSRLTAIRQEMQQKILAVEPLKKMQTPSLKGKVPAVNDLLNSEATRPKRERKVPKHLREAFEEFEGTPEYLRKLMNSTPVQEGQRGIANSETGTGIKTMKGDHEEAGVKTNNSVNKETKTKDENDDGKPDETAGNDGDEDDDDHSGDSWNSDDDPDKLWCICRKPHNNRFMICCDKCEDWFHGHCVGVTRTMGREMEENGLEWICPRCVKQEARGVAGKADSPVGTSDSPPEQKAKSPSRKTDSAQTKKPDLKVDLSKAKAQLEKRKERSASQGEEVGRKCIIASCRNMARASSIYCSDLCIIAHARDSLALISKEKAKHEKPEAGVAPPTPKNEPIKLKESAAFSKLMSQVTPSPTRSKAIVTGHKPANLPDDYHVTVTDRKTGKILKDSQAPKAAELEAWLKKNPTYEVMKPGISPGMFYKPVQRHAPGTPTTPTNAQQPQRKRKLSIEVKEEKNLPDPEVMRNSARSSLKEALWNRCKELTESKVTEEDVAKVAEEVESALYRHFSKDVGTKYKAKYRSLLFNIKDVKNQGLFRKIAERQIKPRDLVKMTAEELASKELAEWREREAKHQLDIIKKTELELVTMSKKYNVVKTHKGEEIIEEIGDSKAAEKDIVVEPVMEILQEKSKSDPERESKEKKDKHREKDKHKHKDKDRHRRESSSSKHHRKDKERDRDRKHDKEKDRSKDKERSKEENNGRKEREKDKERERRHSHKHRDPDKLKKESDEVKKEDIVKEEVKLEIKEEGKLEVKEEKQPEKTEESPKLEERKEEEPKEVQKEVVVEEQEPTSTVNIKTPEMVSSPVTQIPVWKGVVNSSDVGKFSVQTYEMTTSVDLSDTLTKDTLDIVGRIPPQMVWDYIMQTRKVGSREVVAIHFQPQGDSDRKFYNAFLSHMYKTNRYAVVGPVSKLVKDFYIVPLPKDSPIPTGLTALVPDSPVLDENRTSVLIGLIVRSKKGPVAEVREKHHKPQKRSPVVVQPTSKADDDTLAYIPTSKSHTKRRSHAEVHSSAKKVKVDEDDDIPYSPSQLLEDEDSKLDQQQAILEELNHKIEQQKNELISMTSKMSPQQVESLIPGLEPVIPGLEPTDSVTHHSHVPETTSSSTGLTSISIPNNLQEILSAIQKKEEELTRLSQMVEQSTGDVDLRATLPPLPTGDIDMRKLTKPPLPVQQHQQQQDKPTSTRRDPRRKSLNQLTDEELLAKAMEMESSMNPPPPAVQEPPHVAAYYPGPPQMIGPGPPHPMPHPMGPMPPMMGPRPLPPYGPGFVPPRGAPFGQLPGPYWGPPGQMHPNRGPRPR